MRISDWSSDGCSSDLLESPVLATSEFQAMRAHMGESAAEIDCTFDVAGGDNALRDAIQTVRRRAEDAVRGGAVHVILSDENTGATRAPIPMILATGAVHTHLIRQQLRTFTSLNVRSSECLEIGRAHV